MKIGKSQIWAVILSGVACGVLVGQGVQDTPPGQAKKVDDPDTFKALVGETSPVRFDDNEMVASLSNAGRGGKHHERLSAMAPPEAFDEAKYKNSRAQYLKTVEPGRVWQSAQPAKGVFQIGTVSPRFVEVPQGEPAILKVMAVPGAPVTFTALDGGAFSNKLPSITVEADPKGFAVAAFVGTPGTYNEVNILAASPMTSGQARFLVNVAIPRLKEHQRRIRSQGVAAGTR